MASIGPIITVMATGLIADYRVRNEARGATEPPPRMQQVQEGHTVL